MAVETIWDYLRGTDNMSTFGSHDPIAEQMVVDYNQPNMVDPMTTFEASKDYTMTDPGVMIEGVRMDDPNVIHDPLVEVAPTPLGRERKPLIDAQTQKKILRGEMTFADAIAPGPKDISPKGGVKRGRDYAKKEASGWDRFVAGAKEFASDEESMAKLAMGLNTMRLDPDAQLASAMQKRIDNARKTKKSESNVTKTVKYLLDAGRTDLAIAVGEGVVAPGDAVKLAMKKEKPSALQEKLDLMVNDPEKFKQAQEAGVFGGTTVNVGGKSISPMQKEIDKEFAKELVPWTSGLAADTAGNIVKIENVLKSLEAGEALTGPIIGQMPDFAMAFLNPEAVASREAVEGVVQRNLKAVLGAQFTEKEGEKLIKRAYNPTLSGEENAARLRVLIEQMSVALQQKNEMVAYARKNGTLAGFDGHMPTLNDFWAALSGLQAGQKVGNVTYIGGDPSLQSSYK